MARFVPSLASQAAKARSRKSIEYAFMHEDRHAPQDAFTDLRELL